MTKNVTYRVAKRVATFDVKGTPFTFQQYEGGRGFETRFMKDLKSFADGVCVAMGVEPIESGSILVRTEQHIYSMPIEDFIAHGTLLGNPDLMVDDSADYDGTGSEEE